MYNNGSCNDCVNAVCLLGKICAVSIYQNHYLNYLELFFLLNLGTYAATSRYIVHYTKDKIANKQGLAVVMVGSVLVVFCGILGYRIFIFISQYKEISHFFAAKIFQRKDTTVDSQSNTQVTNKATHSLVEMAECVTPSDELREPLLASILHES